MDACFGFTCQVFLPHSKENTFRNTGFKDWKHANEKDKGLVKRNGSGSHNNAMKLWMERTQRKKKHHTIQDSVIQVNLDQKQWLFAIFNVIRYLAANDMPLCGDKETEIKTGDRIFLRTFSQLLFNLDPKLMEIHKKLPGNAKCTSPDVQNEVISILANLVKNKIANDIQNAKLFNIMADGTTDKNRKEIQGLVCRYMSSSGQIEEHCLDIQGIEDRSAKGIFEFIKNTLQDFDISIDGLVSQSFDGASVMSGEYNGLQRLISDFCECFVFYVHCFLHKISLVVVHVMGNICETKEYFDIISSLYNFFKKSAVLEGYEGTALKRLIATRWSGHHDGTNHVNKNYKDIIHALRLASTNKKLKSEDRALAIGLLSQMEGDGEDESFVLVNCMLVQVLKPINIVVKQSQSSHENLSSTFERPYRCERRIDFNEGGVK